MRCGYREHNRQDGAKKHLPRQPRPYLWCHFHGLTLCLRLLALNLTSTTEKQAPDSVAPRRTNIIAKTRATARLDAHHKLITPIIEFFPIECVTVNADSETFQLFATNNGNTYSAGLKSDLDSSKGLYVFYDARGKALYVGQTHKQTLWREMNLAFNRARSAQNVMLASHPTSNVKFRPASEKLRQPHITNLKLYQLATYFSAYSVVDEMIVELEALL